MRLSAAFLALVALLAASAASMGEISYEADSNYSASGEARTSFDGLGKKQTGSVSEQSDFFHFVASPQIKEGSLLRLGVEWQHYAFGLPASAPLPNALASANLIVGLDSQLGDSWLVRIEAAPGVYSNLRDIGPKDLNVPVVIGGSYLASSDLQWVLGLYIDLHSQYRVLPGAGVRWKFAEKWTLDAILPTPRFEYEYSKNLTAYAGFDVKDASYRVDSNFGTSHGNRDLNNAEVDYTEIRAGVGATWKIAHGFSVELETGYMPYRQFNFYRVGLNMQTRDGAPYGQIAISSRF